MKRAQKILADLAILATLGLAGSQLALAQPGGMMMGGEACPYEKGDMKSDKMMRPGADLPAMAAKRLERLKTDLKITPEQEPAWKAFADKANQQVTEMKNMRDKMAAAASTAAKEGAKPAPLSAPEQMAKGIEMSKQRLANMETMQAALAELYKSLTAEQKAVADQHFSHHRHQRHQRMRRPDATPGAIG